MITDIQYEINSFFNELDKKLPGDPFIQKYGPADTFREMVEKVVSENEDSESDNDQIRRLTRELQEAEGQIDDIGNAIDNAIDDLEDAIDVDDEVDIEAIRKVIRELKWAL